MKESQLQSIPEFKALPIYDESDERSSAITAAHNTGAFRAVRECWTLREVQESLMDVRLVPLGALRAGNDGQAVVVAYFGVRS